MLKIVFFIFSFLNIPGSATEAKPVTLIAEGSTYDLSTSVEWFVDANAEFGFRDIINGRIKPYFKPPPTHILNFGYTNRPLWCRFRVRDLNPDNLYMEIKNPDLDSVSVYIFDENDHLVHQHHTGDYVPSGDREVSGNNFFIDLHTKKGNEYTVYLRARSVNSSLFLPLYIAPLKTFYNSDRREGVFQAIYYGVIFFIVIYNLFLFVILKKPEYFYFSAFVFFLGIVFAIYSGYAIHYLWGKQTWLNKYPVVFASLSGIFSILFTSNLLKSEIQTPRRHIWILALTGIYLLSIILQISGFSKIAYRFMLYNVFFSFAFIISIALSVWRRGYKPAGYYIFAWSFFLAGFMLYALREFNVIPVNDLTIHAAQVGSFLAIILISFSLGKKINIYIDNTSEAWSLAASTAEENERLIKHQNRLLEDRVNQRTHDLKQTVQTLQQQEEELKVANEFKDKVFSMISHDLRSPLTTLGGLLNILQNENLTEKERSRILKNLRLSLKHTHDILDNIFEWATRRQSREHKLREFDFHQVVKEMTGLFSVQLEAKSIKFVNNIQPGTVIKTDKNMIHLVLRNLISNAIKFTGKDGTISVSCEVTESNFDIKVSDTGIGMSAEDQKKLFNGNNHFTTRGTNNEKGTGLGLLLCKEFIEKNGGKIQASSVKGKGSTFTVKLNKEIQAHENVAV